MIYDMIWFWYIEYKRIICTCKFMLKRYQQNLHYFMMWNTIYVIYSNRVIHCEQWRHSCPLDKITRISEIEKLFWHLAGRTCNTREWELNNTYHTSVRREYSRETSIMLVFCPLIEMLLRVAPHLTIVYCSKQRWVYLAMSLNGRLGCRSH